jgi:hypothetical protein
MNIGNWSELLSNFWIQIEVKIWYKKIIIIPAQKKVTYYQFVWRHNTHPNDNYYYDTLVSNLKNALLFWVSWSVIVLLSVIMLNAIMLSAIMLSAIMLSANKLSAIKLSAIMLSAIMLSAIAECHCWVSLCWVSLCWVSFMPRLI